MVKKALALTGGDQHSSSMSLSFATLLTGLLLASAGAFFIVRGESFRRKPILWMRDRNATIALFGSGCLWFLWHVANLGEADFGGFKNWLLLLFGGTAVGCFFRFKDLLAARGACILVILAALPLLNSAYMQFDHPQRLLLVVPVYLFLSLAIVCGAMPWILRDWLTWLSREKMRTQWVGRLLAGLGLMLLVTSLTY